MIKPFYRKFFLRHFANSEERKSQKLHRELFLVTNYLWNAIWKNLLPRNLVNGCPFRVPDLLLVIGSSLVYGLSELCGPFGENGKKYPCDGAVNRGRHVHETWCLIDRARSDFQRTMNKERILICWLSERKTLMLKMQCQFWTLMLRVAIFSE